VPGIVATSGKKWGKVVLRARPLTLLTVGKHEPR